MARDEFSSGPAGVQGPWANAPCLRDLNETRQALVNKAASPVIEPVALIDGADSFVAHEASLAALARLLWVRCQEPRQAIRAADTDFAETITSFAKHAMECGERGEVQDIWQSKLHPEWYRRLLSSLPLAGISFACSPAVRDYYEEGRFLPPAELNEIPIKAPYLIEPFAEHALSPIADGSNGNYWVINLDGDHTSPVFIWDSSGMEAEKIYANFTEFIRDAKALRNNQG